MARASSSHGYKLLHTGSISIYSKEIIIAFGMWILIIFLTTEQDTPRNIQEETFRHLHKNTRNVSVLPY